MTSHNPSHSELPEPSRPVRVALLAGLVVLAVLRSLFGTQLDGLTLDEPYHLLAAVAYAEAGDYRFNPEHPPLVKQVVGRALDPIVDLPPVPPLRNKLHERNVAERFVFLESDPAAIQRRARGAMVLFHAAALSALLLLTWRLFGFAWAMVAGAWLALEPTVGAHLPVVMTDLPLALLLACTALTAALAVSSGSWRWAAALGVAAGLALASKHSALPGLVGVALFALAAGALRRRTSDPRASGLRTAALAGRLAVAGLLALLVLWSQYGFRFAAGPEGDADFHRPIAAQIDALGSPLHRTVLGAADRWHLAPRAYLWGLADTLRAGVDGRGQDRHVLFGRTWQGDPPLVFWPGILLAKIPIPHLLLALAGVVALGVGRLRRLRAPGGGDSDRAADQRLALWALAAVGVAHGLALATSSGTYGGVRHALPIVVVLGLLAGGVVRLGPRDRPRAGALLAALLLVASLAVTADELRLWEYHNALAGGTAGAAERFDNEGVHLGQRLPEVAHFWREDLGGRPGPLYALTPVIEEEAVRLGLPLERRVRAIDDTNRRGVYEGFFLVSSGFEPHRQHWGADLAGLERVARFGNVELLAGRVESPQLRASGLVETIGEYLNRTSRPDWATLERRLEELVAVRPDAPTGWILLGNARVALGRRDAAVTAFRRAARTLDPDDAARPRIEAHAARLEADQPLAEVPFLPVVSAE